MNLIDQAQPLRLPSPEAQVDKPNKTSDEASDDGCAAYPGPEVPDPAPWLGQVGEGATGQSGEAIARAIRKLTHPASKPEMPIPDPKRR